MSTWSALVGQTLRSLLVDEQREARMLRRQRVLQSLPLQGTGRRGVTVRDLSRITLIPPGLARSDLTALKRQRLATYRPANGGYRYWRRQLPPSVSDWLSQLLRSS